MEAPSLPGRAGQRSKRSFCPDLFQMLKFDLCFCSRKNHLVKKVEAAAAGYLASS